VSIRGKSNKTSKIETDRILKKPFPKFPEQQLSKNTSVQLDVKSRMSKARNNARVIGRGPSQ